jgi:phage regulator Rha-like protein
MSATKMTRHSLNGTLDFNSESNVKNLEMPIDVMFLNKNTNMLVLVIRNKTSHSFITFESNFIKHFHLESSLTSKYDLESYLVKPL